MNKLASLALTLTIITFFATAQERQEELRQANTLYDELQYAKAITSYQSIYKKTKSDAALRGLIKSYLESGLKYQFNGKVTEGQNQFSSGLRYAEELVAADAPNVENRLLRGLLYLYNGKVEKARSDYELAKSIDPNHGRLYYYLWTLEPQSGLEKIKHPYVAKALSLDPGLFELHQELGSLYLSIQMITEAIASFEKALEISPRNYKAHFSLGQIYWSTGNVAKLKYHLEQTLLYYPDFGYGQMMLAGAELMSANINAAVPLIKKALKNNPQTEGYLTMYQQNFPDLNNYNFKVKEEASDGPIDSDGYPRYYQRALALAQGHDYYSAIDLFHQCRDSYEDYEGRQSAWRVSILSWLSHCYREVGMYAEAIHVTKEALTMAKHNGITTDQASLAANIGMIYYGWSDYPNAIAYTNESIKYLLKYNQEERLFDAYTNLGGFYRKWHKYDSAVYFHELALNILGGQDKLKKALAHKELAISYSANNQLKEAKNNIDLMFEVAKGIDTHNQEAAFNLGAAKVYYKSGDNKRALNYCNQAADHFIELQKISPYHSSLVEFAATISGLMANEKELEYAYQNLISLNNILIGQIKSNFPAMSDQGKLMFYRDAGEYFERFNSFSLTHTDKNQAVLKQMLENQLLKKGLIFNDASKFHRLMTNAEDREIRDRYKEMISAKRLIARSVSMSESELRSRGIDLKELQKKVDSLQLSLVKIGVPQERTKTFETELSDKVRKQLESDEAAIEMIRFRAYDFQLGGSFSEDVYYLALIQKGDSDKIEYVLFKDGNHMEEKGYKSYSNAMNFEVIDDKSFATYWKPFQQVLKGIDKVFFAGDGVFHKININTLYNPETQKYLIEELDIRLVTSTRDIIKEAPALPRNGKMFMIGSPTFGASGVQAMQTKPSEELDTFAQRSFASFDYLEPLPGTFKEVKMIEEILKNSKWKTTVLTGKEAVEEEIKSIDSPTVLHIATHGYFEESNKYDNALLYSGLFLTGATTNHQKKDFEGEDGILTAYEAMHLDLHETQLVVLSACETGMGRIENGEGVYGLQRAFLIAGANSVVMSMWKVNDKTTMELMSDFYHILLASEDKHVAFRQAQLNLKKKYSSPKYWGAFNIVGN